MTPCSLKEKTGGNRYLCFHFWMRFEVQTLVLMKIQVFLGCDAESFGTWFPDVLKDCSAGTS
jgi:hypothetical protein